MATNISIDKAGRIVLPKAVREQLELKPGDSLELQSGEDHIVLRPARRTPRMYKKQGVWVFDSGQPMPEGMVEKTIRAVREERHRQILGKVR